MKHWRAALLFSAVLACRVLAQPMTPIGPRHSGFDFMGTAVQTMQRDDALNPAMLWVKQGETLWHTPAGASGKACASCHGAVSSLRGVATRFPAFDADLQRPINLAQRINQCRQNRQQAEPWRLESPDLLSLESLIALQSRGLPIAPPADARLQSFVERGRARYQQRLGQLDLSCAQCHDQRWGQRLGGTVIPQAHPTGYPLYRLEWQGIGSLQRRLRNCLSGVRAQPWPYGATELVELELYLAAQARGMTLESPAVRP